MGTGWGGEGQVVERQPSQPCVQVGLVPLSCLHGWWHACPVRRTRAVSVLGKSCIYSGKKGGFGSCCRWGSIVCVQGFAWIESFCLGLVTQVRLGFLHFTAHAVSDAPAMFDVRIFEQVWAKFRLDLAAIVLDGECESGS